MAHCFTVTEEVTRGIQVKRGKEQGLFIDCGLPQENSVELEDQWVTQITSAVLHAGAVAEEEIRAAEEKGEPSEQLKDQLRIIRYRDPVIDRADFNQAGKLSRKLVSAHRGDALVHLGTIAGDGGQIVWTANTYEEFVNKKGKVDRTYHPLEQAVGVSLICIGETDKLIAMKPHASIRFERTGNTEGGDMRVMLKWVPPVLHWRTLQAAPGQARKAS
jgi:hypothetical protein